MNSFIGIMGFVLLVLFYFIPYMVAIFRGAKNSGGILVLNFLLAWTGIAWIIALIWAVCAKVEEKKPVQKRRKATGPNLFGGDSTGWRDE